MDHLQAQASNHNHILFVQYKRKKYQDIQFSSSHFQYSQYTNKKANSIQKFLQHHSAKKFNGNRRIKRQTNRSNTTKTHLQACEKTPHQCHNRIHNKSAKKHHTCTSELLSRCQNHNNRIKKN